jgi:lysyl-tRNA synthetase class II
MGRQEEIIKERLKKLDELKKEGINAYPHTFNKVDTAAGLQKEYNHIKSEAYTKGVA